MIARCRRMTYWHSEDVTGYVEVPSCPACGTKHEVVVLYIDEDHEEFNPRDFLNGVIAPCGARMDLILERVFE